MGESPIENDVALVELLRSMIVVKVVKDVLTREAEAAGQEEPSAGTSGVTTQSPVTLASRRLRPAVVAALKVHLDRGDAVTATTERPLLDIARARPGRGDGGGARGGARSRHPRAAVRGRGGR